MATSGPNSGGTFANVDNAGGADWANPSNAASSNNSYATVAAVAGATSDRLCASNFGFSIPGTATINGVVVETEVKNGGTDSGHIFANQLTKIADTAQGSTNVSVNGVGTSDAYISLGSSSDLWGSTWTPAEINATGFGVAVTIRGGSSGETYSVDHIRITVHYTTASGVRKAQTVMQAVKRASFY